MHEISLPDWAVERGMATEDEYAYVNSHVATIGNESLSREQVDALHRLGKQAPTERPAAERIEAAVIDHDQRDLIRRLLDAAQAKAQIESLGFENAQQWRTAEGQQQ